MNMEKIQKVQSCPSAATIGLKNRVTTKAIVQLKQAEQRGNMLCYVQEYAKNGSQIARIYQ